jgi:hypothetical protein
MHARRWWSTLFDRSPRSRVRRRPSQVPLALEILEDRLALSGLATSQVDAAYGQLPLSFTANQGQTAAQVSFLAQGPQSTLFLTNNGTAVLSLAPQGSQPGDVLQMQLVGANTGPTVSGQDLLPGVSNYLIGSDPSQWHTNVPNYGEVDYQGVYQGIDLRYHGNGQQLEYDFVVAPGADPSQIRLSFAGQQGMNLDGQGNLVLQTAAGPVSEQAPVLYQVNADGTHTAVSGGYVLESDGTVGLQVGAYDQSHPLVIDPTLDYSTYLGGSNGTDEGLGIAVDGYGNAYVTGFTNSTNFPHTTGGSYKGNYDAFVTKLNASGSALLYSTYLGGSGTDWGLGIAVDGYGNAYVTGKTNSNDFPTYNAYQTTWGGGYDAFVTKLDGYGAPLYSTYLGGKGDEVGNHIVVDGYGNAYVTGFTSSDPFPGTPGGYQAKYQGMNDAFVTELNAAGSVVQSTYLGGAAADDGLGVALDRSGNVWVTGETNSDPFPTTANAYQNKYKGNNDAFVVELNGSLTTLLYSTYLGGSGTDYGTGIAVDGSGNVYVTGVTNSTDFPTTYGASQPTFGGGTYDAFVTKLDAYGALVYSTYVGGAGEDVPEGIAVDSSGNAYITGYTTSANFPTTYDAYQTTYGGGTDAFVTKLNAAGTALLYSTYLGGTGYDDGQGIAVHGDDVFVTGFTSSTNFPLTDNAYQTYQGMTDAFVTKFDLAPHYTYTPPTILPPGGPQQASPSAVFTFVVREGKHWYLFVWNSDPADPFEGFLLLEGLSKQQARQLHLPGGFPALFLYLPPGGFDLLPLPFTPKGSLTGIAF